MRTITALLLICTPLLAFAHSSGLSWQSPSGSYVVDVGYTPDTFSVGTAITFDFILRQELTPVTPYSHVWVRIVHNKETLLATGIVRQAVAPTTLVYMPLLPGDYVLEASYRDADGTEIAAASLPFSVAEDAATSTQYLWYIFAGAAIVTIVAGYMVKSTRGRTSTTKGA